MQRFCSSGNKICTCGLATKCELCDFSDSAKKFDIFIFASKTGNVLRKRNSKVGGKN